MSYLEFKKQFGVRFLVSGNKRKFLDAKVSIFPLENKNGGDTWYVYKYYKTKRKFIEKHNKVWSSPQVIDTPNLLFNPTDILLNPDDYDLTYISHTPFLKAVKHGCSRCFGYIILLFQIHLKAAAIFFVICKLPKLLVHPRQL